MDERNESGPGLLVLALDAADPELLLANLDRLPNIARLLSTGDQVRITHEPGLYTGSVWPTLNTGMSLRRHGRYFFKQFDHRSYLDQRTLSEDLPDATFWERASDAGRRVAVVDVPKTRLAGELNGVHVLDWTSHDPEGPPRTFPPEELDRLPGHKDFSDRNVSCDRMFHDEGTEPLLDLLTRRISAKTDYALSLMKREPWDLVTLVYNDTHCAGHQFWAAHDPGHPRHDAELVARIGDPLLRVLELVDAGIGRVLAQAGDARILFFTSHGMGAHYDASAMLDETLLRIDKAERASRSGRTVPVAKRRHDALAAARGVWRTAVPRSVRDLFPGLDRFSGTIAADTRAQRRCFAIPANDNAGAIRFNIIGREPQGRLAPGPETDAFISHVRDELHKLRNAKTGSPVVTDISEPRPIAESFEDDLPDLVVRWNRDEPIDAVSSDTIGMVEPKFVGARTGDHRGRGLAVLAGRRDEGRRVAKSARAEDVPATILDLLGVDSGEMDGRSFAPFVTAAKNGASREPAETD